VPARKPPKGRVRTAKMSESGARGGKRVVGEAGVSTRIINEQGVIYATRILC